MRDSGTGWGLEGHAQSLNSVPVKALMSSEAKLFHFPVFPHTGARPAAWLAKCLRCETKTLRGGPGPPPQSLRVTLSCR